MAYSSKSIHNQRTGQTIRFIQTSQDTGGALLEMETTYAAQSREPVPHYHPHQTEEFRVMAGELTVRLNGKPMKLRKGDTLHIGPQEVHSMWNASDQPAVVNWQVRPALDTEYFFEITTGLANDGKTNQQGMPPLLQTVLLANRFSNVFRLTKPGWVMQKIVFALLSPIAYLFGHRPVYRKYLD